MRHPYQCLSLVRYHEASENTSVPPVTHERQFLLAACGPGLFNLDVETGKVLGQWPEDDKKNERDHSDSSTEIITGTNDSNGRARKRRKTKPKSSNENIGGAITRLIASSQGGCYAVAATDEDKSIHVFQIEKDGQINHLSQRRMTKRPCAIAFTPTEDHILVGDKFGDVYALPLKFEGVTPLPADTKSDGREAKPAPFKPSATNLTVHTGRNLKALKNQMLHHKTSGSKPREAMSFDHDLLLGHVSMLTDLTSVSVASPELPDTRREYIITCDRDEHVRISRGRQQAHIIENYCFGHTQFLSKLCVLGEPPSILVSGGGDNDLYVWDWLKGRLLGVLPIQKLVQKHLRFHPDQKRQASPTAHEATENEHSENEDAIAVSGLWQGRSRRGSELQVWCACEGVAALFQFEFKPDHTGLALEGDIASSTYELPGNPLGMVVMQNGVLVSVDTIHLPGSTASVWQDQDTEDERARLVQLAYSLDAGVTVTQLHIGRDKGPMLAESQVKKVGSLLYGMENLRKHSNEEPE